MIKMKMRDLDAKQGPCLEIWLRNEMEKKGYNVKSGHYPEKNGFSEGECDFVLKDKKLCFLELKKRLAIRDFDEMDDVGIWSSIGQGLLYAQKQCFSHELYLLGNNSIDFEDGNSLNFDNNLLPAVKMSISYGEHSYICSKAYVAAIMKIIFSGAEIMTKDPNRQSELDKFNKYSANLRDIVKRKKQLTGKDIDLNRIITHSIFCSAQQLLQAIWNTGSEQDFFDIIKEWQYKVDEFVDQYVTIFTYIQNRIHPEGVKVSQALMKIAEKKENTIIVS